MQIKTVNNAQSTNKFNKSGNFNTRADSFEQHIA
jgi:hypothetical protein